MGDDTNNQLRSYAPNIDEQQKTTEDLDQWLQNAMTCVVRPTTMAREYLDRTSNNAMEDAQSQNNTSSRSPKKHP